MQTLVAAITAADLASTLTTDRFTVFAPSDAAFAALPEGALDALLADKEKLISVLKNHVVSGTFKSKKVKSLAGNTAETIGGGKVAIKVGKVDGVVTLDAAKVTNFDIKCSNGYIHIIDAVLIPK